MDVSNPQVSGNNKRQKKIPDTIKIIGGTDYEICM